MEFNVLIGGEGGQGAFSVKLELTETLTSTAICLDSQLYEVQYWSQVAGGLLGMAVSPSRCPMPV